MKAIIKNLMLSVGVLLQLTAQVNAKQQAEISNVVSSTKPVTNASYNYSYSISGVKNSVSVINEGKADSQADETPMKAKSFTKTFNVDNADKINLDNQFGSITIKTWDRSEIKVDVDMKAYAKTEQEAQKLIDDVSINATKSGNLVSYKTEIGERNGNWGSSVKKGKTVWRREVKVYYVVYMPANNSLSATQQYGNILMGDFAGPTSIKVQYGKFNAGELNNTNNYVNVQYGSTIIREANGLKLRHQYESGGVGVTIGTVGTLDIDVQYAGANVTTVKGNAIVKHQYGRGITIGSVNNLTVNSQYAAVNIGTVRGNLSVKQQYEKVTVNQVQAGNNVDVSAQYSTVSLGFAPNYSADFDVRTQYADFRYGDNVTAKREGANEESKDSQNKNYRGQIGKGGGNTVSVNVQYNGVTFK